MAELTQGERLQPSLLDRLVDDEPKLASGVNQTINTRQLKGFVKRDLALLLNSCCLEDVLDLSALPLVSDSVLNYGMPELTGIVASTVDTHILERKLINVITRFEPRIIKRSLRIKIITSDEMSRNALRFEIECDVWGQPVPERMYLFSEIDLESGTFKLQEQNG